jgi:hypothetical protein
MLTLMVAASARCESGVFSLQLATAMRHFKIQGASRRRDVDAQLVHWGGQC